MPIHAPVRPSAAPAADSTRVAQLEDDVAEAVALLKRLLAAEDRIGLVFPVMDDAREFLSRLRREHG